MHTITFDPGRGYPVCPGCGTPYPLERILGGRSSAEAVGHCANANCRNTTRILLPEKHKKLVYLDQSFISAVWDAMRWEASDAPEHRIFARLLELKERQDIFIVVSDIHGQETAAIPEQNVEKRQGVWKLANSLADGTIAGAWDDIFITQQRSALVNPGKPEIFLPSDLDLKDPFRVRIGMRVIATNAWRLALSSSTAVPQLQVNDYVRNILQSQENELGSEATIQDCLTLVRELWRKGLLEGIAALKAQRAQTAAFLNAIEAGAAGHPAPLEMVPPLASPFGQVVAQVVEDLEDTALDIFNDLLLRDPTGGCACVRLMTAFEAEMLWRWHEGKGKSITHPKRISRERGQSRLQDFRHVSAFLPYVDVLTTDDDMANWCKRELASAEVAAFSCKLFSTKSYPQFGAWLDDLASSSLGTK